MNPIGLITTVAGLVAASGAGAVVGNAVKASTPANLKTINKVLIGVGGFVLSSMVADQASKHVKTVITDNVDAIKTASASKPNQAQ